VRALLTGASPRRHPVNRSLPLSPRGAQQRAAWGRIRRSTSHARAPGPRPNVRAYLIAAV